MVATTWRYERAASPRSLYPTVSLMLGLVMAAILGAVVAVCLLSALGLLAPASRAEAQTADPITRVYYQALPGVVQVIDHTRLAEGPRQASVGSGFVVDEDGHILTNHHVVQVVRDLAVVLSDGSVFQADLVGEDPSHDLALLRVSAPREKLHPLTLGDTSRLEVGRRVVAIGSPYGLRQTLTQGVVSFVGRPFAVDKYSPEMSTIQTDAAINPGNSGGPLLDLSGNVIGVNVAAYGKHIGEFQAGSVGVGFAIPADDARRLLPEMIDGSLVAKPWLGIFARNAAQQTVVQPGAREGAMVTHVLLYGPADEAGLRGASFEEGRGDAELATPGDVIVSIDGWAVSSAGDLATHLAETGKRVGERVTLRVVRGDETLEVSVRLRANDDLQIGAI